MTGIDQHDQYYRVRQHWARLLDQADPTDTKHVAYLKDKLSAATAVIERRQQMSEPRIICSWCGRDLGPAIGCEYDTHGICAECARRFRQKARQGRDHGRKK